MKFWFSRRNVEEKTPDQIQRIFRHVFLSPKGQEVLKVLLNDWSFFDVCKTEQQRALNEYAKVFLHERLGIARINVYADLDEKFKRELEQED